MCGISGLITSSNPVSLSILKSMTNTISHRGPNGDGHWINSSKNVGLGHRRLAIIDLSCEADQPMTYLNGRYRIVFNGEIYNYIELREKLIKKGYQFKNSSDTEILPALFDDKREKCLEDLDGMFAFAIWDEEEKTLFCARDRFGEKPFYYSIYNGKFYFASEMKALWAAGVPRQTNNIMLYNYLLNDILHNPKDLSETFFDGIKKLKAAHYFFITPENIQPTPKRYWNIDLNLQVNIGEDEAVEKFSELFFESVKRRLRSDVPVGSSLSGGLDSSSVVCAIDRLRQSSAQPQMTFSARFRDFVKDEGEFMEMVINQTNVDPHFVFPDEEGLLQDFDKLCHHQEEPFGSASIYVQFCVMRLAKENNVTVLLDGQGADEILAGYLKYFVFYFEQLRKTNKNVYYSEKAAYKSIHGLEDTTYWKDFGNLLLKDHVPTFFQKNIRKFKKNISARINPFLSQDFFREYSPHDFYLNFNYANSLKQALYKSTLEGELENLLRYADRNSMAHSREVRLPFLSHHLVEFMFSLPDNFKIRDGVTKFLMRKSFANLLPRQIVARMDKIGYEPPQNKWLNSKEIIERTTIAQKNLIESGILVKNTNKGFEDSQNLWRFLMADIVS